MRAVLTLLVLVSVGSIAHADCAAEARTALQARLTALPLREELDVEGDGGHSKTVLELESFQRFSLKLAEAGHDAGLDLAEVFIDGKAWTLQNGQWQPLAAAVATAADIIAAERALADQYTTGAVVTCLGPIKTDGRALTGYDLTMDADPSTDAPYATMRLLVDPASGLPQTFVTTLPGDTGTTTSTWTLVYDRSINVTAPVSTH